MSKTQMKGESKKKPKMIDAKRRGFLQGSAMVGTVAATGVASADLLETAGAKSLKQNTSKHAGYRETDHVREYYAKARF
ncbi:MAG: twin-arginine translocation signal domain-containing protein [Granulosicoccaceae bacterium]